jgi:hypothetical protein
MDLHVLVIQDLTSPSPILGEGWGEGEIAIRGITQAGTSTSPGTSVASLAYTASSSASPFDWAQDRRRKPVRNAG